jgi:hypothetical protein
MILMIGSGESKAAPKGANHDEISPAEWRPRREIEPDRFFSPAKITKSNDFGPSHLNGYVLLPKFRVAAINRAFISYPEA